LGPRSVLSSELAIGLTVPWEGLFGIFFTGLNDPGIQSIECNEADFPHVSPAQRVTPFAAVPATPLAGAGGIGPPACVPS